MNVVGKPVEKCVGDQLGKEEAEKLVKQELKVVDASHLMENSTTPGMESAPKKLIASSSPPPLTLGWHCPGQYQYERHLNISTG